MLWLVKTKMCDGGARAFTYTIISPIKILMVFLGMMLYVSISNVFPLRKEAILNIIWKYVLIDETYLNFKPWLSKISKMVFLVSCFLNLLPLFQHNNTPLIHQTSWSMKNYLILINQLTCLQCRLSVLGEDMFLLILPANMGFSDNVLHSLWLLSLHFVS